ncbi:MAG: hypothetical protein KDA52_12090 [Planctomycetaceae bacterium]|nr:hypothetical protein [Planctomycetaceae bacterium]
MPSHTHIIIPSCDAYSDAWGPFFQLLYRYWPDCPYPLHLVSINETYEDPRVHNISLREDRGWASNLRRVIDELKCQSIVYLQEDYFLQSRVDTKRLESVIRHAQQIGAGYVRLAGAPNPDLSHDNPFGLGEISRHARYRCSLQAAWWNGDTLRKLLVDGETGWDMELMGSQRSAELPEPFLATYFGSPLVDYSPDTGILKGKWVPGVLRFCRREGIEVDTSRRGTHAEWPLLLKRIRRSPKISAVRSWLKGQRPAA